MPKTLLLADDSVTIQKVVGLSFASEDVVLVTVSNGDDAVTRARELRPDIVLADVVMPGRNGYEVCEAIKTDPELRHIPVLLLTGTFEAFDQERARRAGADGHVTKPFEAQTLVQQVRELLARPRPQPVAVAPPPQASPAPAQAAPAAAMFFDDDVPPAENLVEAPFAIDSDAAAGELELATVAEDESEANSLFGATRLVSLDAPGEAPRQELAEVFEVDSAEFEVDAGAFDVATDEFDGDAIAPPPEPPAPLTDTDPLLARAVAPEPAGQLPDDAFDLGFDEPVEPLAEPAVVLEPPPPASSFGDDDPSGDTVLDSGGTSAYDLTFSGLEDPLASSRGGFVPEPSEPTEPTKPEPAAPAPLAPVTFAAVIEESVATAPTPPSIDLSPVLRDRLHDTLEKIAWEAFADVSDTIVRQAIERIERIAWEVIPQMAEQLVREEIRRMKGEDEAS